jgi:SAM-dependent methyltransferase
LSKDWVRFHHLYETWPPLQARLQIVRQQIGAALAAMPPGRVRILSLCAGDGRDLLGALSDYPRATDVEACLIDNNAELVARGEAARAELGLPASIRFLHADATCAELYLPLAPADLVVAAGVFGHLEPPSMQRLVQSLCSLCKTNARVIWTHRIDRPADEYRIALLRQMLHAADFDEQIFTPTDPPGFVVATHAFNGQPLPLVTDEPLFDFR